MGNCERGNGLGGATREGMGVRRVMEVELGRRPRILQVYELQEVYGLSETGSEETRDCVICLCETKATASLRYARCP